jgi:hypothetical protein
MKKLLMPMLLLTMLIGCSSQPTKSAPAEKAQPKGPEFALARTAFQKTYIAARGWAPDAKPFRLESANTADSKGKDGKSAVWRASFASAAQKEVKPYFWSGTDADGAPARGVSFGSVDSYNPTNSSTLVFDIAFLKVDSDKALEVAQKHGGDKLTEKTPDLPVWYVLDWNRATGELIWHVIYGESRDNPQLRVAVNASTGDFLRVEK